MDLVADAICLHFLCSNFHYNRYMHFIKNVFKHFTNAFRVSITNLRSIFGSAGDLYIVILKKRIANLNIK